MQNIKDLYYNLLHLLLSSNKVFYQNEVVEYIMRGLHSTMNIIMEHQNELGLYGAIVTQRIGGFITSRQVRRLILIELKGFDQQTTILLENISEAAKDRAYQVDQTRVQINTRMILTWSQRTIRQTKTLTRTNERNKRNWLRPPIQSFLDCVISWSC